MSRSPLFELQKEIQDENEQIEKSHARLARECGGEIANHIVNATRGRRMGTRDLIRMYLALMDTLTPELAEIRQRQRERLEQMHRKANAQTVLGWFCTAHTRRVALGVDSSFVPDYDLSMPELVPTEQSRQDLSN